MRPEQICKSFNGYDGAALYNFLNTPGSIDSMQSFFDRGYVLIFSNLRRESDGRPYSGIFVFQK